MSQGQLLGTQIDLGSDNPELLVQPYNGECGADNDKVFT